MDLSIKLCGIKLDNPTILASGILGVSASSMLNVINNGAGAVTTKSCDLEGRPGHPNPKIISYEHGLINAVGLTNPGIKEKIQVINDYKAKTKQPIILSLFAKTIEDFGKITKIADDSDADLIEINISCPNVQELGKPFAFDQDTAARVTTLVKENTSKKIFVKLSPITPEMVNVAKACKDAGADGITAINTLGPGMVINIDVAKPVLSNKFGGVSGPAIRPIAVKSVYQIYEATKLPIIGMGGVMNGRDAIEMLMAGASAVGIGSAVYYNGVDVFKKVTDEITAFMKENNYKNIKDLIGIAHE